MIKNYLTIALRALWRSKVHSFINIFGLSLGIACCVLIVLFVKDELSFDKFHSKADRIYRVFGRENWGENQEFFYTVTPFPMGPALKDNFAEIEAQARITKTGTQVKVGNDLFNETVTIADRSFFHIFDFEILKGSREGLLDRQSNIVITDWVARKYFGTSDAINKTISIQLGESFEDFTVIAVTKVPRNSSIQFYLLISDQNLPKLYNPPMLTTEWFNITPETYVLLAPKVDPKTVIDKFPSLFKTIIGEEDFKNSNYAPGLQPFTSIHLDINYPVGIAPVNNPKYVYILSAVALLVLLVACINFITLSIGRSLKRAREVGIRKVVGALRRQLITQFIGEALVVTLISLIIGLAMALLCLPLFNTLSGKQLEFPLNGFIMGVVASLLVIIGIIAGSYPALVLSAFRPISILKGTITGGNRHALRKVLVGLQLILSIFLISSTLVMRNQLQFLQNKNLGFNKEQLAVMQLNVPREGRLVERIAKGFEKAEQLKSELLKFPDVAGVCASSHDFANGGWTHVGFTDDKGVYRTFNMNVVDDDYLPTLKIELMMGRNFSEENLSDKKRAVIVNEAFVRSYGWKDITGQKIPGKNFPDHEIIGVIKDFNYESLYTKVEPLVLVNNAAIIFQGIENINMDNSPVPKLMVRLKPGNIASAIEQIKSTWKQNTNGEEFSFTFVDEAMASQYRADQDLGKIIGIATVLAIVIGSLGLYGLASLSMQNRVKEISIRKILGATEQSLLILLSKDYVKLILISLLISVPFTWYFMHEWLSSFEYRVSVGVREFMFAGGISLMIALLTISYQAIKTAWSQPAETLKHE